MGRFPFCVSILFLFLFIVSFYFVLERPGPGEVGPPHLTLNLPCSLFVLCFLLLFC